MNKPKLLPRQENFVLPDYIQEQIRVRKQMTQEERAALVEAQRSADPGEKVPFAIRERRYIRKSLLRDMQRKKPE